MRIINHQCEEQFITILDQVIMSRISKPTNSNTLIVLNKTVPLIKEKIIPQNNKIYNEINNMLKATLWGMIIGGTIGFFTLPIIGLPIGAILGGCSPFITLIIIGLIRLFTGKSSSNTIVSIPEEPDTAFYKLEKKISTQPAQESEPIFSPSLFKEAPTCPSELNPLSNDLFDKELEDTHLKI